MSGAETRSSSGRRSEAAQHKRSSGRHVLSAERWCCGTYLFDQMECLARRSGRRDHAVDVVQLHVRVTVRVRVRVRAKRHVHVHMHVHVGLPTQWPPEVDIMPARCLGLFTGVGGTLYISKPCPSMELLGDDAHAQPRLYTIVSFLERKRKSIEAGNGVPLTRAIFSAARRPIPRIPVFRRRHAPCQAKRLRGQARARVGGEACWT